MRTWSTRHADQPPGIGHQHDVVALRAPGSVATTAVPVARGERDVGDALAAAAGDAVFIGRGALAEAAIR